MNTPPTNADAPLSDPVEDAKDILAGCLFVPRERIDADADIASIGEIDSLSFEMIVLELQRRIGGDVDPMQLLELRTVRDLAAILEQAK
jgi:acyl carrier protein